MVQNFTWFTRIWVLQELVISPDPWVQIGGKRMRWDEFTKILNVRKQGSRSLRHISDLKRFRESLSPSLWRGDEIDDWETSTKLLGILSGRRGLGVTDAREY